jgi:uncharacterized protein
MSEFEFFDFPCCFQIKAMGKASDVFVTTVCDLIAEHATFDQERDVTIRPSKNKQYYSVTISITAHSRQQLDAIYQTLTDCEQVLLSF